MSLSVDVCLKIGDPRHFKIICSIMTSASESISIKDEIYNGMHFALFVII